MDFKVDKHVEILKKLWKDRPGLFKYRHSSKQSLLHDNMAAAILKRDRYDINSALQPMRVLSDGNCLFRSVSILLIGNESLAYTLRKLTASELYMNSKWYARSQHFDMVSANLKYSSSRNLFAEALSDKAFQKYSDTKSKRIAIEEEAIYVNENFKWASFMCVMGVSSVIKIPLFLVYQNFGDKRLSLLFNTTLLPRESCGSRENAHIFWYKCGSSKQYDRPNHFVPLMVLPSKCTHRSIQIFIKRRASIHYRRKSATEPDDKKQKNGTSQQRSDGRSKDESQDAVEITIINLTEIT